MRFATYASWSALLCSFFSEPKRPLPFFLLLLPPTNTAPPTRPQTRITTQYSIKPGTKARKRKSKSQSQSEPGTGAETPEPSTTTTTTAPKPPRGVLTLKTYDPASGATLKYRTTKAAEVGRLVQALGRLGARMAGLPPPADGEDVAMAEAPATAAEGAEAGAGAGKAAEKGGQPQPQQQQQQQGGGGGGGKGKKKKGKR